MGHRVSKTLRVTLTRDQLDGDGIEQVAIPQLGSNGRISGVQARCTDGAGGESATIIIGKNGTLANPWVEDDTAYESAATAFTVSATTADLRDPTSFPYPYEAISDMQLAMVVTGMGASDFTLVITIDYEVEVH